MENFQEESRQEWLDRISKTYELEASDIEEIAEDCLEETNSNLRVLKNIDKKNLKEAERAAHTIKGATSSLGRDQLSSTAADIEKKIKNNDLSDIKENVKLLETSLEKFRTFVRNS